MLGGISTSRRALLSLAAMAIVLSAAACSGDARRDAGGAHYQRAHYCYEPNSDRYYEHTSYDCPADHFPATEEAYRNYLERASQPQPTYRYCWDLAKGHPYAIAVGTCQHDDVAMSDAEMAAYRRSGQPPASAVTQPVVAASPAPPQPAPAAAPPPAVPTPARLPAKAKPSATEPKDELVPVGYGSAFFVSSDGHLLTNHHVVAGCDAMMVITADNTYPAKVVAANEWLDLAILKVRKAGMPFAAFAEWLPEPGDDAYAVGYPLLGDLSGIKITDGIVSGLTGPGGDDTRLQLTIPVQPGNSGGPVLDASGLVIGVVTGKYSGQVNDGGTYIEGVSFAIIPEAAAAYLKHYNVRPTIYRSDVERKARDIMREAERYTWPAVCLART
ncbi:S1C family serine protease [Dongia deserti]|uniref:S1C family serine protease n=1 Tax=Dongia deserti TaxID=2268030 RepID=UPI000E646562|nr:serine protease [Dongia deserti]